MDEAWVVLTIEREPEWLQMLADGPVLDQLREEILPDTKPNFARFLLAAAHQGRLDIIFHIFDSYKTNFNPHNPLPLIAAAHAGHLDVIKSLITKRRLDINASIEGITAVGYCVVSKNEPAVRVLKEHGAATQFAPLAARRGDLSMLTLLVEARHMESDVVCAAAESGQLEIVRLAIEQRISEQRALRWAIKENNPQGALTLAAANGHVNVVSYLLDIIYGANNDNPRLDMRNADALPSILSSNGAMNDAAANGHLDVVQHLCERMKQHGYSASRVPGVFAMSLAAASGTGQIEVMRYLLDKGASIYGRSELAHEAAARGDMPVMLLLLEKSRQSVNITDGRMASLIYVAAKGGHLDIVRLLVEAGARINLKGGGAATNAYEHGDEMNDVEEDVTIDVDAEDEDQDGGGDDEEEEPASYLQRTALMAAAQHNHFEIVRYLIAQGAFVNEVNELGWSALTYAVHNVEIMRLLLDAGATLKGPILQRAICKGTSETVGLVLQMGAKVNGVDANGMFPLGEAARAGNVATVELLLKKGAKVDAVDKKRGRTAFYIAATNGHAAVLRCLIAHGSASDKHSSKLQAPLYLASKRGHLSAVELLVELGADVNRAEPDGYDGEDGLRTEDDPSLGNWTPLMAAASENHKEVVALLLTRGAKVDANDSAGRTAYDFAACNHLPDMMEILESFSGTSSNLQRLFLEVVLTYNADDPGAPATLIRLMELGANVNRGAFEASPDTPLMTALKSVRREHVSRLVTVLLEHGANPNTANKKGESVLALAAKTCSAACVGILLSHGATVDMIAVLGACQNHDSGVLNALLAYGAAPFIERARHVQLPLQEDAITPYSVAITSNNWRIIPTLATHGADINELVQGKLGLQLAVDAGESTLEAVRAMLDAGAPVRTCHVYGVHILHLAYLSMRHTLKGCLDFIELLRRFICHGADLNVRAGPDSPYSSTIVATSAYQRLYDRISYDSTLLETIAKGCGAMDGGLLMLVRMLLEHGADPTLHDGAACRNLTRNDGTTESIHLLIDYGALGNANLDTVLAQMIEWERTQYVPKVDRIIAAFSDIRAYRPQPTVPVCLIREVPIEGKMRRLFIPPWTRALQGYTPLAFRAMIRAILMLRRTPGEGEATWGELPTEVLEYIVACTWEYTSIDLQTIGSVETVDAGGVEDAEMPDVAE